MIYKVQIARTFEVALELPLTIKEIELEAKGIGDAVYQANNYEYGWEFNKFIGGIKDERY